MAAEIPFTEPFYQNIQKWLKTTKILEQELSIIHKEFGDFIFKDLRPIDRQILFDDLYLTLGAKLTNEGLSMLVRLETWAFNKKK